MKKIFSLLLLLVITISSKAQSGATCATAIPLSATTSCSGADTITGSEAWFSFVADSATTIVALNKISGGTLITKFEIYSGSCDYLLFQDSTVIQSDTLIGLTLNSLSAGTTYFVKVLKPYTGTSVFSICLQSTSALLASCSTSCGQSIGNSSFESNTAYLNTTWPFACSLVDCWGATHGNPQIGNTGGGSTGSYYATMWAQYAGGNTGEGIYTNVNLVSGRTYVLNYSIRKTPTTSNNVDAFYIKLTSSAITGMSCTVPPGYPSAGYMGYTTAFPPTVPAITIASNAFVSSTSWTQYNNCFVPAANYNKLFLYPVSGSGGIEWIDVDDVQITPLKPKAGPDQTLTCSTGMLGDPSCPPIPGVTYSWSPTTGLGSPTSYTTTVTTNGTASTTMYVLTATIGSCSDKDTVIVTSLPVTVTVNSPTICAGQSATLTATGGNTYSWSTGATSNPISVSPTTTTSYTVTGTVNTCSSSAVSTVTVNPLPVITGGISNSSVCSGATIPATSFTSSLGGTSYSWTNSNTAIGLGANGTGNVPTFTATNSAGGTISGTITVTPSTASCTGPPSTYTITVTNPVVYTVSNLSRCNGTIVPGTTFSGLPTGVTFSWTNSDPSIGLASSGTGNVPAFTGINTGTSPAVATITVTPSASGCTGSPITYTITINPTPDAIIPSNRVICAGTVVPVIPFSSHVTGATFSWTNSNTAIGLAASGSGSLPSFTATNTTGSPITATITVTPTASGCSGTPASFTITVNPTPSVSVSPTAVTITIGGSTTLTASGTGGTSYSWLPTTGLSCTTCSNPIATPTETTTYTVTLSNNYGCSATATSTVTVLTPCNVTVDYNIPDGRTSSAFFGTGAVVSNKSIIINGVFTVDAAVTFSGCNIIMAANGSTLGKIDITGHAQLTLLEKTHLYSCGDMWDGIYIGANANLTMTGYTFIEDATNAVVSQGGGKYFIESSIFNCNLKGVDVQAYAGTHTGLIANCVFTSRNITTYPAPASNPTVGAVKTGLTGYADKNMKNPNASFKGIYGVFATSVNALIIGADSLLAVESSTSHSALNVFDNIASGITLVQTNARIYNNQFQYLLNTVFTSCVPGPCYTLRGYGVNATGASSGTYSIKIGGTANIYQPNTFYNIYRAISVTDYKTTTILKNSFDNSTTAAPATIAYGDIGVYVKPASNNTITITDNAPIRNCATAIWIDRAYTTAASTNSLQIDNNGTYTDPITANGSGFCNYGIYISDLTATPTTVPTAWEISGNVITETNNGIFLQNVKRPASATSATLYNIISNSNTVRYATTGALSGITAKGCDGLSIQQNHTKYNSSTAYTSSSNLTAYGIYLEQSTNMLVKCNQIDGATRGLTFYSTCTSILQLTTPPYVGITQNTIHNAYDGFVLKQSGIIGTQGSSTIASNNYWDPSSTFTNTQTFTDNTTGANANSKLYMNSGAGTFPTSNNTNGAFGISNYLSGSGLNTSSGSPAACGSVPALTTSHSHTRDFTTDSIYTHDLVTMEEDSTLLIAYNAASHWQRKNFVYNEIHSDNTLTANEDLNSFYTDNAATAFGQLATVQDALSTGDYAMAGVTNDGIVAGNILEQNQQQINRLLLLQLNDSTYIYTSADSSNLYAIAIQCPIAGGNAVYQARNLLMSIEKNVLDFPETCETSQNSKEQIQGKQDNTNKAFRLYPNPNNGNMTLEYTISTTDHGNMQVMDYTGKLIANYVLDNASNKLTLNCTTLDNGVYFYRVIINKKTAAYDKLIIIK